MVINEWLFAILVATTIMGIVGWVKYVANRIGFIAILDEAIARLEPDDQAKVCKALDDVTCDGPRKLAQAWLDKHGR